MRLPGDVAGVAANVLVAARAERLAALASEDDHADLAVLAGCLERPRDVDQGLWPEGVVDLGPVDRDLGDALGLLVTNVGELAGLLPVDRGV
jgi:hypothetical protein